MSRALTSHYEWADHYYPLHAANYALLSKALDQVGLDEDRYAILKPACPGPYKVLECRKAAWVQYYINALALGFDLDTVYDINACETSSGESPEDTFVKASLTTALAGVNNDLKFTARVGGTAGNLIQVAYVVGVSQPLTVAVVGTTITVRPATNASSVPTSTAAQVAAAIAANVTANNLVAVTNAGADTGAGAVTAMALTNLSGGLN
jgi:hypothetical protein